ncbi:hypothetical protein [Hyphomicrobium sp.]|uniref:hypothetical protein n=1 Tax=Hyphomicrobium sp. TaxID=82 RepID=UPI000FC20918|nr:hypothetical protein [Hyphomicrobium sp.]RUO97990.1 MAG: hypothetical protein EKK30_14800 [Hyphomicrobium sp.]
MNTVPLNRRAFVIAAGLTVVAPSLPSHANSSGMSSEYLACEEAWIAAERVRLSQIDEHPTASEIKAQSEAGDQYRAAKEKLLARPIRNIFDAVALLRTNVWYGGNFIRPEEWMANSDELRTLRAIEEYAGTGSWAVPVDLIALEQTMIAKEELWQKSRKLRVNVDRA